MDEDTTWYGIKPRPRPHCVRHGPSSPAKGVQQLPLFGRCLLWQRSPISATAELFYNFRWTACSFVLYNVVLLSAKIPLHAFRFQKIICLIHTYTVTNPYCIFFYPKPPIILRMSSMPSRHWFLYHSRSGMDFGHTRLSVIFPSVCKFILPAASVDFYIFGWELSKLMVGDPSPPGAWENHRFFRPYL